MVSAATVLVVVSAASVFVVVSPVALFILLDTDSSFAVWGRHVGYTVTTSFTVAVAVLTMAGLAVSEQTPLSHEVTVTKVVCCRLSVVLIGHHVVYSVVTPFMVAVLVDTIAGLAVLLHTSDSHDEIVTTVVCLVVSVVCSVVPLVCFVVSVVDIGHQVVYSVVTPDTVTVAVETIAGEILSVHTWLSHEVTVTNVVCSDVFVVVAGGSDEAVSWEVVADVTRGRLLDEYVGDLEDSELIKLEELTEPAEEVSDSLLPLVDEEVGITDDFEDSEKIEVLVVVLLDITLLEITGEDVNRLDVTLELMTEDEITLVPLEG